MSTINSKRVSEITYITSLLTKPIVMELQTEVYGSATVILFSLDQKRLDLIKEWLEGFWQSQNTLLFHAIVLFSHAFPLTKDINTLTQVELSLLDTIGSWTQLRPITTEVIRRLFPKGKFIVVNGGHELSQPILDKLQSMICELSERKYNPSHNQKKFVTAGRELPEGKNVLTITDSTSLETEREDTVTDYRSILLCIPSKDVHERELRELFCLTSTTSEEPLLNIYMKPEFRETVHLICKVLETIRILLADPHSRSSRKWKSLSFFTIRKPEEAAKCKANGGIGYIDLDCACGDQWDGSLVVVGIVQYASSKTDATSRFSSTDDVKRKLESEWSTLEELLTTLHIYNRHGADLLTTWKHKFHVISSSLVFWHVSPTTTLETMFTMIRCVLDFDRCSVFAYDPLEDVWIAHLYNYPTEKQMRVAHSWKNVSEMFSPLFPADEPIIQDADPKHLVEKLNQVHKNEYWLLLKSDSSDSKAIVQFTSREDFSETQRRSIEQDLSSLCSSAVQW
ncbi:hypothetical protein CSKR_201186, partial [Clonorchis sinensis]